MIIFNDVSNKSKSIHLYYIINWSRYPFDWRSPIGYLIAFATQFIVVLHLSHFGALCVRMIIGVYLLTSVFHTDLEKNLKFFNKNAKQKVNQPTVFKKFADLIDFHAFLVQLSVWNQCCKCVQSKSRIYSFTSSYFLDSFVSFHK